MIVIKVSACVREVEALRWEFTTKKVCVYIRGSCLVFSCHVDKLFGERVCGGFQGSFRGYINNLRITF